MIFFYRGPRINRTSVCLHFPTPLPVVVNFVRASRRSTARRRRYVNSDDFSDIVSRCFEKRVLYACDSVVRTVAALYAAPRRAGTSFFTCPVCEVLSISRIAYKNLVAITKRRAVPRTQYKCGGCRERDRGEGGREGGERKERSEREKKGPLCCSGVNVNVIRE